jgi:hypothetical protein
LTFREIPEIAIDVDLRAVQQMAPPSPSSSSMSTSEKESLLLSHLESTDEWTGWCTVESEPVISPCWHKRTDGQAIFNQLLWDIGVSEAQIHEIYSLDLESFESIE